MPTAKTEYSLIENVVKNYQYLWQGSHEIILQQLIIDPIQDTIIKGLLDKVVKSNDKHQTHTHCHGHSHGNGFVAEWLFHFNVKAAATLVFPLIYSLKNFEFYNFISSSTSSYFTPVIKILGINPLEMLYAANGYIKPYLGDDNIIFNNRIINYFKDDYITSRSNNTEYGHFIDDYRLYMETVDSLLHTTDYIEVYFNNDILYNPKVAAKAAVHASLLGVLYHNTESTQTDIDNGIYPDVTI
jgi:hypothetical protein